MSVCALCQCHLNSDVTELTDATLMEILIFLKLPNLPASNFVCKLCLEKISYVAKLRVSLQNESFQINPISDGLKSSVIGKLLDKASFEFLELFLKTYLKLFYTYTFYSKGFQWWKGENEGRKVTCKFFCWNSICEQNWKVF